MQQYIKLIAWVITISILSGCSKFLDRPQENKGQQTKIDYTNLSNMYQPVSGVYRTASSGSFGRWIIVTMINARSDDSEPGTADAGLNSINHFQNDVTVKSYWGVNDMWINLYGVALAANSALAELDEFGKNIPASDAVNTQLLTRYRAEVRFFRGLAHYYIGRYWGAIPILGLESNNPFNLAGAKKSSIEDVKKYVMAEMDTCIASLEDARPNEATHMGGVTKYTALTLKAKAALDLAGNTPNSPYLDVVLDCTNQIINSHKFSLFKDYYNLWKKAGKLSDEAILEFQYSDFGSPTGDIVTSGTNPGETWANFFLFQGPANTRNNVINGSGWMVPKDTVVGFLKKRDDSVRLKTTIQYCGINGDPATYAVTPDGDTVSGNVSGSKYFNGKAYYPIKDMTPGRVDYYGANNNIHMLRYADVLLMNAEAKIRKGQSGDAEINEVRQRVKLAPLTGATLDQLLEERHAEFICEWWGERFNDLLRTDKAATELKYLGFQKGTSDYLPIPQAQEDVNSNLK